MNDNQDMTAEARFIQRCEVARAHLRTASPVYAPSNIWSKIADGFQAELAMNGLDRFKHGVNRHLGSQVILKRDHVEYRHLAQLNGRDRPLKPITKMAPWFREAGAEVYADFICMLWDHALTLAGRAGLPRAREPLTGDALWVRYRGSVISEDLARAAIEWLTLAPWLAPSAKIAEIGGGYGRLADLLMTETDCRCFLFDIPPTLALAEWYMETLRPGQVCPFIPTRDFNVLLRAMEGKRVVLLSPDQIELFPDGWFDAAVNIDSFGEMAASSVEAYMAQMSRVIRPGGFIYLRNLASNAKSTHGDHAWTVPGPESYAPTPPEAFGAPINRLWPVWQAYFEALLLKGA